MKRFILILFLLLAAREIRAFGLAGHAAIACIAEHHLTPRARANIMRYTDHRSIVYYASWMDEWRRSKGYESTTQSPFAPDASRTAGVLRNSASTVPACQCVVNS